MSSSDYFLPEMFRFLQLQWVLSSSAHHSVRREVLQSSGLSVLDIHLHTVKLIVISCPVRSRSAKLLIKKITKNPTKMTSSPSDQVDALFQPDPVPAFF